MITINLADKNVVENYIAIQELKASGMFTDEQLQELYDKQVKLDKRSDTE